MRILFVCLGNICRSPTAESVMRSLVEQAGLQDEIEVESAGTGDWHIGRPRDAQSTEAAKARGIALTGRGRQVTASDFDAFDLIVAMDRANLRELQGLAPGAEARTKIHLLREFDPASAGAPDLDVPDPYHGGRRGFEDVFDLVEAACEGLLAEVREEE